MSKHKTVVFDLETINSISNFAKKYQMNILDKITGGISADTMNVIFSGRQTGKSTMALKVLKNRYYGATDRTFWADTNLCKEIMFPEKPQSKYKFSRAKWHTASLNGNATWRFSDEYNQIIAWCNDTFGPHPKKQDAWSRWYVGIGYINFRDEQDLILYKLKWS